MKSLIVTKIVQKIKPEENCGELEAKNFFQRQSCKGYMRGALVFMSVGAGYWGHFNGIGGISLLGGLGVGL